MRSHECIFVLRMRIIRFGADGTCHSQKEMEVIWKNYRLANNNNKYWKHAEKIEKPEIPRVSQRQIVITIHKYSEIFGDQQRDAFSRGVYNEA